MVLCILVYQICGDKPSEEIPIADLYAAWYIFLISSSGDTTVVSDVRQVGGFPRVFRFPPPIKLTATIELQYC